MDFELVVRHGIGAIRFWKPKGLRGRRGEPPGVQCLSNFRRKENERDPNQYFWPGKHVFRVAASGDSLPRDVRAVAEAWVAAWANRKKERSSPARTSSWCAPRNPIAGSRS